MRKHLQQQTLLYSFSYDFKTNPKRYNCKQVMSIARAEVRESIGEKGIKCIKNWEVEVYFDFVIKIQFLSRVGVNHADAYSQIGKFSEVMSYVTEKSNSCPVAA